MPRPISRREFLRLSSVAVAGTTLIACTVPSPGAPAAPGVTFDAGAAGAPVKTVWGTGAARRCRPVGTGIYWLNPEPNRHTWTQPGISARGGGLDICTEPLVRAR